MKISKIRRKLNDSGLGQRVNGSIPGILVEGTSRFLSDTIDSIKGYVTSRACFAAADLVKNRNPIDALTLAGVGVLSAIPMPEDADGLYSHTSPLYGAIDSNDGKTVVERVPVGEALLQRVARRSPATALSLAILTYDPRDGYLQNSPEGNSNI